MKAVFSNIKTKTGSGRILLFLLSSTGGVLWIMSGIILANAPAGHPPFSFRTPVIDVRPHLALGLLVISFSLGMSMLACRKTECRRLTKASIVTIAGGVVHFLGRIIRDLFLQGIGWEPLLPLGFLLCIGGLFTMGVVSFRSKAYHPVVSILLIVTATFLLCFNDQYLPFMAIPFGMGVIALSAVFVLDVDAG